MLENLDLNYLGLFQLLRLKTSPIVLSKEFRELRIGIYNNRNYISIAYKQNILEFNPNFLWIAISPRSEIHTLLDQTIKSNRGLWKLKVDLFYNYKFETLGKLIDHYHQLVKSIREDMETFYKSDMAFYDLEENKRNANIRFKIYREISKKNYRQIYHEFIFNLRKKASGRSYIRFREVEKEIYLPLKEKYQENPENNKIEILDDRIDLFPNPGIPLSGWGIYYL